jgi:hypothetical protein
VHTSRARIVLRLGFSEEHSGNCALQALALWYANDRILSDPGMVDDHNCWVAAHLIIPRKPLSLRRREIDSDNTETCAVGLFDPIHDGRGLRSRNSGVGIEEDKCRPSDCWLRRRYNLISAGDQVRPYEGDQDCHADQE